MSGAAEEGLTGPQAEGKGQACRCWGLGAHRSVVGFVPKLPPGQSCGLEAPPGKTPQPDPCAEGMPPGGEQPGEAAGHSLPLTDTRLGRMVTEPSATSSRCRTGEILEPQLSEPIQMKCPVWFALLAASSTLLWGETTGTGTHWHRGAGALASCPAPQQQEHSGLFTSPALALSWQQA